MAGSVSSSSPIVIHLVGYKGELVHQITRDYMEVRGVTIIRYEGNYFLFEVGTGLRYYTFRQVAPILDLDEVKGKVELKADFVRDPRALDYTLFLLQHNEISLGKAKEIVEYWSVGIDPLSSDLPVVTNDNPLVSENDAPMDILREVREDIIKRREQDVQDAAYLASFIDRFQISLNPVWVKGLNEIVEHLTVDAHGKPVPETLKGPWSFKIGDPRLPKFAISESNEPVEIFQFKINSDGTLSPEMKAAGATIENVPGVGRIASLPIKGLFDGPVIGKLMVSIPQEAIEEFQASMELAMRQFSDNVRAAVEKFRAQA